ALIESTRGTRTPLPVLTRGEKDKGVQAQANLIPPFPALEDIQFPNRQAAARLGDTLVLSGHHLDGASVGVVFNHSLWDSPIEIAPLGGGTAATLSVLLPNNPAVWPASFYTVALMVQRPGETFRRTTNLLSFALAPSITITPANTAAAANIVYT